MTNPFAFPLAELLWALPTFLGFGEAGQLAWKDPAAWLDYVWCIFAWFAGPTGFCAITFELLRRRLGARGSRPLARIAWTLLAFELGLAFFLWTSGYWLLGLPVGIVLLILWIHS